MCDESFDMKLIYNIIEKDIRVNLLWLAHLICEKGKIKRVVESLSSLDYLTLNSPL